MENILYEKGLKIVFWNIRSILNKIESVRTKLHDKNISILVITESWLKPDIPNTLIDIEGYATYRYDRSYNNDKGHLKRGGGILVYVRDTLSFDTLNGGLFNVSSSDIEFTTLCIKRPHTKRLYLISIYRPPNGNVKTAISTLENSLKFVPYIEKSDIFLGGDFNIDFGKNREENTKKLKHFATKHHLTQHVKDTTRPLQGNAIIDLIFTNCTNVQHAGTLPWNVSDHIPVLVNIKKRKAILEKVEFKGRSYRRFDENVFLNTLEGKNWRKFENSRDANIKWEILYKNVLNTLDEQIPVKTFTFPKSKPEWLVAELVEYMKDRDSLLKKASRTKDTQDKKAANKARNKTNRLIKSAKNNFIQEKLNEHRDNPKKFWEQIKSTYPTDKNNNPIRFSDQEGHALDKHQTATLINDYFTNIGPDLAKVANALSAHIDNPGNLEELNLQRPNCPELSLHYPSFEDFVKRIKEIKIFKSSGLPLVASRIWKVLFLNRPNLLYNIIKTAIDTKTFPNKWKKATVVPIPKVTKPIGPEDLRPISLLPLPGKIFEHLLHSQINNHLETYNLLTEFQNGFRSKHSTTQTVFNYTSELTNSYNNRQDAIAIYIDFKKAFDTVNHSILINKLPCFKFGDDISRLLKSYLTERTQTTFVNGQTSGETKITYGVPQGSVLGPKLFLMFINDLVSSIQHCKYYMYADDIVMFKNLSRENPELDLALFKQDIKSIERWCLVNELTINIKKTKLQYFPCNRGTNCTVFENNNICKIYNQELSYVNSFKYLGVDIDKNLSMKNYFDTVYKLVNHKLYLLKLIRTSLTIDAALSIGKSMILSLIDYGNIFLTGITQEDKSDLQKLQNRILRCCLNIVDPMDINTIEMHSLVNVEMIDKRRTSSLLTIVHRGIDDNKFDMLEHNIQTRHNDGRKIDLIWPRNEHVRKSSLYKGTSSWNNLSLEMRNSDLITFKNKVKEKVKLGEIQTMD